MRISRSNDIPPRLVWRACAPIALAVLVTAPAAQLPPQPEHTAQQDKARVARRLAAQLREKLHAPGLSVAVAAGGRLVFSAGFGRADLEHGIPVTRLTKFRIGSLSKLITAAAVGKLVEAGDLDLDASVRDYVSYFPQKKWPIRIRQLCAHTGGIRHYGPNDGLDSLRYFPTVKDGIAIFAKDPLEHEPGTRYRYSSYGYNLVSAVIESAGESDFLHFVRANVLEPLAMQSTEADDRFKVIEHRTRFYHRLDEGVVVNAPVVDNSYKWASGGYLSSAEDLVRLALAHCAPGFLRQKTLDAMFEPQPNTQQKTYSVGIGWRISEDSGRRYYHHGGAIAGGRAFLLVYPEEKVAVALLTNMFVGFGLGEAKSFAALYRATGKRD